MPALTSSLSNTACRSALCLDWPTFLFSMSPVIQATLTVRNTAGQRHRGAVSREQAQLDQRGLLALLGNFSPCRVGKSPW